MPLEDSSKIRAQILKLVKSHQALGGRGGGETFQGCLDITSDVNKINYKMLIISI